jgi:signal transduction histidine kinase
VSTDRSQEGAIEADKLYFRRGQSGPFVQEVHYSTALERVVVAFAAPVMGSAGRPVAVVVGRSDLRFLDALLVERAGLGATGRSFLVNRFNYFVSASPGGADDRKRPIFSLAVKRSLDGETGAAIYRSHDDHEVAGAFRPIPDLGLALISEMDIAEAFAPIYRFRIALSVLFVVVGAGAAGLGMRMAWGISRPIQRLAHAAGAIGDGDLEQQVDVAGPREVTALARAFNGMAHDLSRSRGELLAHSTALEGKVTERTRNLAALLEVTQALGSTLDLTETLWCAARSLVRVLEADAGVAYVLDEGGDALRPTAGYQLPPALRSRTDRSAIGVKAHAFVADACDSHQPAFARDATSEPRLDPALLELWDFRSVLFVPMFSGGRLVGGLFAGWTETRPPLAQEELKLIDGIGRQAGIAVQNAALFMDSERRRHAAETLSEIDAVLAGSLDRDVVAQAIVRGARALLDARLASAYGVDPVSGDFCLLAAAGEGEERVAAIVPGGVGIAGAAVAERAVVASADVLEDPRLVLTPELRAQIADLGAPAMLAVPLRVADRVIGVLCIHDEGGRRYTTEETRLLPTFASQAALALENARLYDDAQARATRMTRLGEFGRMITASLDLREVLDRVAGAARELVDADLARVWVAYPAEEVVRLMAAHDRGGTVISDGASELPLGVGVAGYVMTERRRHYSPDLTADPFEGDDWLTAAGYTSRLAVPLIVNDRPVGVLTILTKERRVFGREDDEIIELFAAEAATAVENARLFADTEAQTAVLAKKNAELDAFAYSVSHDLKAPLVTIQAMCGMLVEDEAEHLGDEGRRVLSRIEANATHLAQLIGDLLTLSRVGRDARQAEAVPVREVIDDILGRLSEQIRSRGVDVVCTADATVWGVRVHLEQVFANLISNSVKYLGTTASPRVEIHAEESDGRFVEFSVRDNGIGIDPAYHARVFDLFQRLRDIEAEGTGVGLALVKKIVENVDGRVWVDSRPGEGATFRFTWPVAAPVRAA